MIESKAARLHHDLRGRLNTATLALCVAQKQIEVGETETAQQTLQEALGLFSSIEAEVDKTSTSKAEQPRTPRQVHALLVEDNINECALLLGYLRLSGFEVEAVNDGQAALDYLTTRGRPDVVLLDMRLPTRSGPEILESIRGNPSHRDLKVFAMTGASSSEYGIPTGPGGVDGWFSKPLNPPRMIEALKSVVARN
jgi:CheY-like chemotaxis protein